MKIELHHIGRQCVLKKLELFQGSDPLDLPKFTVVGTRGDKVILQDHTKPSRQFIISQKEIVLI